MTTTLGSILILTSRKGSYSGRQQRGNELTKFRSIGEEEPPVKSAIAERPEIPRKVKPAATAEKNGHAGQNGDSSDKAPADGPKGVKRSNPDDGGQPLKKAKLAGKGDSDVVTVEDSSGAILIGD